MKPWIKPLWVTYPLVLAGLMSTISACDNDDNAVTNAAGEVPDASPTPLTTNRRVYEVQLFPANSASGLPSTNVFGSGRFTVENNQLGAYLEINGLAPGMMHMQHIHSGTQCADITADTNNDGIIDEIEAAPISGRPIIPLSVNVNNSPTSTSNAGNDPNLTTDLATNGINAGNNGANNGNTSGNNNGTNNNAAGEESNFASLQYPVPTQDGTVTYIQSLSLSALNLDTLNQAGTVPNGAATPTTTGTPSAAASPSVSADGSVDLDGLVVEVHGVPADAQIPATVRAETQSPVPMTIPVACGRLVRINQ